jgi:hypothetical protein
MNKDSRFKNGLRLKLSKFNRSRKISGRGIIRLRAYSISPISLPKYNANAKTYFPQTKKRIVLTCCNKEVQRRDKNIYKNRYKRNREK